MQAGVTEINKASQKVSALTGGYRVAVIGGGPAGVSFSTCLVRHLLSQKRTSSLICIDVFDPGEIGAGLPYQEDYEGLLLNVRANAMIVDDSVIGSFKDWCIANNLNSYLNGEEYLPRSHFGAYLRAIFFKIGELVSSTNIKLNHIREEVIDIDKGDFFKVKVSNGDVYSYDFVILCVGNSRPKDNYGLSGCKGYINNPYPVKEKIFDLPQESEVAILGASLTAIDVVISLIEHGHKAKIRMYSRHGSFPSVKGIYVKHTMKFLTTEAINVLLDKKRQISIRDIYRLFRKEIKSIGGSIKQIFMHRSPSSNINQYLTNEIFNASFESKWQAVLIETNEVVELCWHRLKADDKTYWLKKMHSLWLAKRCPMPLGNAKKIKSAIDSGQLEIISNIHFLKPKNNRFEIVSEKYAFDYQYIINATGPSKNIEDDSSMLITNLLNKGYLQPNKWGGVLVDFDNASAVNVYGEKDDLFKVIGHLTCGTYYYTSSFTMISKKANKLAEALIRKIDERFFVNET